MRMTPLIETPIGVALKGINIWKVLGSTPYKKTKYTMMQCKMSVKYIYIYIYIYIYFFFFLSYFTKF